MSKEMKTAGICDKCKQVIERHDKQSRQEARRLHFESHSKIRPTPKQEKEKKKEEKQERRFETYER